MLDETLNDQQTDLEIILALRLCMGFHCFGVCPKT